MLFQWACSIEIHIAPPPMLFQGFAPPNSIMIHHHLLQFLLIQVKFHRPFFMSIKAYSTKIFIAPPPMLFQWVSSSTELHCSTAHVISIGFAPPNSIMIHRL
jgi:hypothetical protein